MGTTIDRHLWTGRKAHQATPNVGGRLARPRWVVIHFTGGASGASSANWLCDPRAKASAHVVVDRDGSVIQLAPFNVVTWHAGRSVWKGVSGLNAHSIGVEIANAGILTKRGDGKFYTSFGTVVPDGRVIRAAHKNEPRTERFWEAYTEEQVATVRDLLLDLRTAYPTLEGIVGHDDIAPGRKADPGPAAPMAQWRSAFEGRDATGRPPLFGGRAA